MFRFLCGGCAVGGFPGNGGYANVFGSGFSFSNCDIECVDCVRGKIDLSFLVLQCRHEDRAKSVSHKGPVGMNFLLNIFATLL